MSVSIILLLAKLVRVVPSLPSRLPKHVHHAHLEDRVDGFDADSGSALRHGKDIHHSNGEVVNELAQHQAHDLHGNTSSAMSQHLEKGEGGDVDGLGVIDQISVILW